MSLYRVSARAEARGFAAVGLCTALMWLNGGCNEAAPSFGNPASGLPAGQGAAGIVSGAAGVSGTAGIRPTSPTSGAGAGSVFPVAGTYSAAGSGGAGAGAGIGAGAGAGSGGNAGAGGNWDDADSGVPEAGAAASGSGGASGSSGVTGTSGSGGHSGNGGNGGTGGAPNPVREDLGEGDGKDVVLIGDSWMSNTLQVEGTGGGIVPYLQRASGQPYRNYAVQGVMLLMADSFGPAIPTQWDAAKRADPDIKTVVMTGGGNDIIQNASLQASCEVGGDECKQTLLKISETLDELWTRMADSGVQDIVYVRYSDDAGTLDESLRGNKGVPWPAVCSSGKVRCYSVDTNNLVNGAIALDGIHPLGSANSRIANAVVKLMADKGMRR